MKKQFCRSFIAIFPIVMPAKESHSRYRARGRRTHSRASPMADRQEQIELALLDTLDHLLDRGVVIAGEAVISIGDVDLLYLGLNIVLANVDTLQRVLNKPK